MLSTHRVPSTLSHPQLQQGAQSWQGNKRSELGRKNLSPQTPTHAHTLVHTNSLPFSPFLFSFLSSQFHSSLPAPPSLSMSLPFIISPFKLYNSGSLSISTFSPLPFLISLPSSLPPPAVKPSSTALPPLSPPKCEDIHIHSKSTFSMFR